MYRTYPWLDDFRRIPRSMHDELASAVVQYGKAIEINAGACLLNPTYPDTFRAQYVEYLAYLKDRGVRFSPGTDSHAWFEPEVGYTPCLGEIAGDLASLGLAQGNLWHPGE